MIFTEFRFVFFFLAVWAVYWSLAAGRARKVWLLVASYVFYAAWDWRFLSLILISTAVDYLVGLRLDGLEGERRRRSWLLVSLVANLGILGFFKYFNFFVTSGAELLSFLGLPASPSTLRIVLPVGISFYTLQTLSYSIDVYRRKVPTERDPLNLAVFVAFFPQLLAGPILRAAQFLPQLAVTHRFADVRVRAALVLFLVGYVKKACVSDNLSPWVDQYYASPAEFSAASCWLAMLLFSVQLYCDFSGYSDIAIACAALLGYSIPLNFDFPFLARNVRQLWQRWHISLSLWIRDYVFAPLGGYRRSRLRGRLNLLVAFTLCGLWHRASWPLVALGAAWGAALVVHGEWKRRLGVRRRRPVAAWVGPLPTFLWFTLSMVLLRAPDLETAGTVLGQAVGLIPGGAATLPARLGAVFAALAVVHWLNSKGSLSGLWQRGSDAAFAAAYGGLCAVAIAFTRTTADPFIYFQF